MDQHVSQLKAILSDATLKVSVNAGFIPQARVIGYLTGRMIYACGMEARFKDRTPYFTVTAHDAATTKTAAVKSKRKPKGGNDFGPI